ncbi:uncharacterized protein LOC115227237 [Octopus sinensis]|uniref:Uncharacterized protein LOC115227237 n=1 Tax=Octopus sinensis TaxID=2607531 RepID=A0A6P7TQH4_9MOLL|nr:uncharacterized protein LOC115227237 [Octopus sinensis]
MMPFLVYSRSFAILIAALNCAVLAQFTDYTTNSTTNSTDTEKKKEGLSKNVILLISAITPCLAIPVICVTVYLCYLLRDRPKPRPLPPPDMVERMYLEAQRNATLRSQSIFNSTEHIVTSAL